MKLMKRTLKIRKFSDGSHSSNTKHSVLLPNSIRCIICGPSNCGKTNIMLSLLLHKNGLKFQNVYLYSKTVYQPKYRFLEEVLTKIPDIKLFMFQDGKGLISPDDALENSVVIFDDVTCENQHNIRNYFSMGRHRGLGCFYLSQTYSKIPKQLIRDNVNFLIIFKQDDINLKHILDEHVNNDMSWRNFKTLASNIWKDPYCCLILNKDCELINHGRCRKLFDEFVKLE